MAPPPAPPPAETGGDLFSFVLGNDLGLQVSAAPVVVFVAALLLILLAAWRIFGLRGLPGWTSFEIEEAEFGLGDQKITLRPNDVDRQIAYKIWVELSTRKIGLPIDLDHDVVVEVYDSWYSFFAVTRELIKDIPVAKVRRKDTEKIVRLSIEVLNHGLRPHLTQWQARFRRWYERAIEQTDLGELSPQDVQKKFPEFDQIKKELQEVNERLIKYRKKMYELVTNL